MNGNEIKARISIEDEASGKLARIGKGIGSLEKSVEHLSRKSGNLSSAFSRMSVSSPFEHINTDVSRTSNSLKEFNSLLNGTTNVWTRAIKEEIGRGLTSALSTAMTSSFNLAKSIETNSVGIAGILTSAYKLNGKQMEWNDALKVSRTIINDLSKDALATSASVGELVETFRALLGPAGQAGMSISQIENLSVVGTNAVKSLGLGPDQYVQELRDLVQGGIRSSSSTLATSLGIADKDIDKAKNSSEGLYNFLMDKMKGFKIASEKTADTVQGAYDQITESVTYGVMEGQQKLFDYIRDGLNEVKGSIVYIDDKTKKVTINPELLKNTERISNGFITIGNSLKTIGDFGGFKILGGTVDALTGGFERLSKYIVPFLGLFAYQKGKQLWNDVKNAHNSVTYKPKTMIGGIWQDKRDLFTGRRRDLNNLTEISNNMNDGFNEIEKEIQKEKELESILETSRSSIRNLADEWQNMGVKAENAIENAKKLKSIDLSTEEGKDLFQKRLRMYEKQAEYAGKVKALFDGQADALRIVVDKEKERESLEKRFESLFKNNIKTAVGNVHGKTQDELNQSYVEKFINDNKNGYGSKYAKQYADDLKKLGFEQSQVNEYTRQFIQVSKGLKKSELEEVFKKATDEAKKYKDMLGAVKGGISPEEFRIESFVNDASNSKERVNAVKKLQDEVAKEFDGIKIEAEEANRFVVDFIGNIERISPNNVEGLKNAFKQATKGVEEYKNQLKSLQEGLSPETFKINSFINDSSNPQEQIEKVKRLQQEVTDAFKGIKVEAEETNKFVADFIDKIKKIDPLNIDRMEKAFEKSKREAQEYAKNIERVQQAEEQERKISKLEELQILATRNAFKLGGHEAVKQVQSVIKIDEKLRAELTKLGASDEKVYTNEVKYLTKVAEATEKLNTKMSELHKKTVQNAEKATGLGDSWRNDTKQAGNLVGKTGDMLTDFSLLSGALLDITGKSDSWEGEMADDIGQAGMMLTALENISKTIYTTLIPALADGIKKLHEFGTAMESDGIFTTIGKGIAGATVTGAGAIGLGLNTATVLGPGYWIAQQKKWLHINNYGDFLNALNPLDEKNVHKIPYYKVGSSEWMQANHEAMVNNISMSKREKWIQNRAKQIYLEEQKQEKTKNVDTSKVTGNGNGNGGGSDTAKRAKSKKPKDGQAIKEIVQEVTYGYDVAQKALNAVASHVNLGVNSCAKFVASFYSQYGLTSPSVQTLIKQAGSAYHKYTGKEALHAGDVLVWDNGTGVAKHVGIYDGNGHSIASDSKDGKARGVKEYSLSQHPYGNIVGYISSDEITSGAKATIKVTKEMQKQYERSQEIEEKLNAINDDYKDIFESTSDISGEQDAYVEAMTEGMEKVEKWQHDLAEIENLKDDKGNPLIDTSKFKENIEKYKEALSYYAFDKKRQQDEDDEEREINRIKLKQQLGYTDIENQQAILREELEAYKKYLQDELDDTRLSAVRKADIEQKLANTISEINDAKRTDAHSFTEAILADYEAMSINYADYAEDVLGTIESAGVSLISSFDTAHTKIKEFFTDVTKSILENMSKIIMKGLMMNAVLSIFGKDNSDSIGFWTNNLKFGNQSNDYNFDAGTFDFSYKNPINEMVESDFPHFANGGIADGLSIVGENGAELVDFKNPARVYSHNESKKLIGGGNVNVKLDIHNESGVPVTAESQGTTFDGEQYVMSVVLKGIANNTMGSRTILKTLAQGG